MRRSFNVIHLETMFKADVFVSQGRPFDGAQMDRRVSIDVSQQTPAMLYLAIAEDTVLAKLEWYRLGGEVSDRQWRDILGVLKTQGNRLDSAFLQFWAEQIAVADLLSRAMAQAKG